MGTDILYGIYFHKIKYIYSRLPTNMITINGSTMVLSTPPTITELNKLEISVSTSEVPRIHSSYYKDTRQHPWHASSSFCLPPAEPV